MDADTKADETKRYREQWAANFRGFRLKRFTSQDDFVAAIREIGWPVTRGAVSHWERGFRLPSVEMLPAIARILRVRIARLMPEPDPIEATATVEPEAVEPSPELMRAFDALLPSEQRPPAEPVTTMPINVRSAP